MKTTERTLHLNDYLDKAYILTQNKNYEEFLVEMGATKNTRACALFSEPTVSLSLVKDEYVLCTSYPEGRLIKVKFKVGEEISRRRPAGGETTSTFQVVDNTLVEDLHVDGRRVVVEREFTAKDLMVKMEVNDVKCLRCFTIVESGSVPSFATETSRRLSLGDYEINYGDGTYGEGEVLEQDFSQTTATSESCH